VAITREPYAHPATTFARREANNTQKHFDYKPKRTTADQRTAIT
jgi:hypothetical protein